MNLDLTPLNNAITRLSEGLTRYESDTSDIQIR
ncbi:MAG: nucleotidyltransferase, partial [Haemophilus parahaemolyticus]|nr:nucleotidyltransferase [Haemophilus parahaemolyticus]